MCRFGGPNLYIVYCIVKAIVRSPSLMDPTNKIVRASRDVTFNEASMSLKNDLVKLNCEKDLVQQWERVGELLSR